MQECPNTVPCKDILAKTRICSILPRLSKVKTHIYHIRAFTCGLSRAASWLYMCISVNSYISLCLPLSDSCDNGALLKDNVKAKSCTQYRKGRLHETRSSVETMKREGEKDKTKTETKVYTAELQKVLFFFTNHA